MLLLLCQGVAEPTPAFSLIITAMQDSSLADNFYNLPFPLNFPGMIFYWGYCLTLTVRARPARDDAWRAFFACACITECVARPCSPPALWTGCDVELRAGCVICQSSLPSISLSSTLFSPLKL